MGESLEVASSFVEIIAGIGSRTGLHPMRPAVAKNIMTKYHSSATISLKRKFTKADSCDYDYSISWNKGMEWSEKDVRYVW